MAQTTLIQNISAFAVAAGTHAKAVATSVTAASELAIAAGNAAATAQTSALAANSRLDAISQVEVSAIRVQGTGKPINTSLTGLEAASSVTQDFVSGDAFENKTQYVLVKRTCLATIIGWGEAPPPSGATDNSEANMNFRLLIRRKPDGATGNGNILVDGRSFARYANNTASLTQAVTMQLNANDRINVETCCYGPSRGNGKLWLSIVEHPQTLALDGSTAAALAAISTQLASIETRLAALESA